MTGRTLHGGIDFDLPWQSEIVPGVWQGGVENGMALTARFVHVVSLYRWGGYRPHPAVRSSLTVTMLDSGDLADLDGASIHRTAEWVNACRRDLGPDEAVLVHCQAGLNRSGVVTALALMLNGDVATADEAIALLRARRGEAVLCNPLFVTWLRSQEAVIRGERAA
jgi:protein-tyrosine phosphatase